MAETMHNYLLFGRLLQCELAIPFVSVDESSFQCFGSCSGVIVPPEKVHPKMFAGAGKEFKAINWKKVEQKNRLKGETPEGHQKRVAKLRSSDSRKRKQLEALGVDYEFPGYVSLFPFALTAILGNSLSFLLFFLSLFFLSLPFLAGCLHSKQIQAPKV